MSELDKASTFPKGLSLGNVLGIWNFTGDPSSLGFDAPQGSVLFTTDSKIWQKSGALATDWTDRTSGIAAHKDTHKSGGTDAFVAADLLEAHIKRILESGDPQVLTVGAIADGQVLTRVGNAIVGANSEDVGPDTDVQDVAPTVGASTTSQVYVDMPGAAITTAVGVIRKYLVVFTGTAFVDKANKTINIRLLIDGVVDADSERQIDAPNSNALITIATSHGGHIDPGVVVKMQWAVTGGASPAVTLGQGTLNAIGVQ